MTSHLRPPVTVGLLVDHPAHYLAPAFRALAGEPSVRPRVYFWRSVLDGVFDEGFGRHVQWNTDLHGGYDWWCPPSIGNWACRSTALLRQMRRDRPQVVLSFGWASPVARLGTLFAAAAGAPLLFYGDTNGRNAADGHRSRIRSALLRGMFAIAAGAIDTGVANREFYRALGMSAERIHAGVLPAHVEPFLAASRGRSFADDTGRTPNPLVIGYVGKFIDCKAPDDLVHAVARLAGHDRWTLWLIGDGPLRPYLEILVERYGLAERVRFLGFRNSDEVPGLMATIDVLVLPSRREARGLVVVEALAAGAVPVVSSATGVWGSGDAVEHDATGLIYPVGDAAALAACLERLLGDETLRRRLAAAGRNRVAQHGPSAFAATTATAVNCAASGGSRATAS
jgi:glycosyltransferase involved in cell wall biosynthesis